MAGLPLFHGTFRNWMTGGSTAAPKPGNVDSQGHGVMGTIRSMDTPQDFGNSSPTPHPRSRQSGIRDHTDDSCELPRGADIIQHISESCRGHDTRHTGIYGHQTAAHGAASSDHTANDELDPDLIEAAVDQLKDNVHRLREANRAGVTPRTGHGAAGTSHSSTRNDRKPVQSGEVASETAASRLQRLHEARMGEHTTTGPIEFTGESAASRLQRLHEARMSELATSTDEQPLAPIPPSPMEFPSLGQACSSSKVTSPAASAEQSRRTSYAHAATSGMMDAIDHAFAVSRRKRNDSKFSDSTSQEPLSAGSVMTISTSSRTQATSTEVARTASELQDDDKSVIVMSETVGTDASSTEAVIISKESPSTPIGKTLKEAPRFAQPTKSFARRAGETLRKDSASASPKSPAEGSPTKSIKLKDSNYATTKRASQPQQKRKSLPGDWLNTTGQRHEHTVVEVEAKSGNVISDVDNPKSPTSVISPSSADGWQIVDGPHAKENAAAMRLKARDMQQPSPLRKKTSSYMAPTSAATQRTKATLGGEKTKRAPIQKKAIPANVSNGHGQPSQQLSQTPRPSTASSENSSVHFILDRPDVDVAHSPNGASSTPARPADRTNQRSPPKVNNRTSALPTPATSTRVYVQKGTGKAARPSPATAQQAQQHTTRSESRASEAMASLPGVANTTTKRRTSHGHLLTPIVACLDSKGLLNRNVTNNAVVEAYLQSTASEAQGGARRTARMDGPGTPTRRYHTLSNTSNEPPVDEPTRKVLPPHLRRSRETSTASTSTDATLCQEPFTPVSNLAQRLSRPGALIAPIAEQELQRAQFQPLNAVHGNITGTKPSLTPSLRATAAPFEPGKAMIADRSSDDWWHAGEFIPDEEWSRLTPEMRVTIQQRRAERTIQQRRLTLTLPTQFSPPQAPLIAGPDHSMNNSIAPVFTPSSIHNPAANSDFPRYAVQAGQVLRPSLSPGKKSVQWMLQDVNGEQTPIKFGRAPPPSAIFEPSTPTISSTSEDTSPMKTPHSMRGWHIGSSYSPNPYAWKGGDGKEIRFIGYGPHAERDPNSVVDFDFHSRTNSFTASVPNGFKEEKENLGPQEYVAPRSQRQWAERVGYPKVPCGNVEITHAVEHMPFGSQLAGYCYDCTGR
ncbi:hypothetical protein LTR37_013047 [Vermiconidia calcicola]|uniref:Uncharacterized protein n=1 Tax=Vermiconidia calcicola TaxID=1690605 RepID=A0ACC3MXS2_9PEZI|nr:hypothetical protein LTR37_013047 [Vermiconidia calcicola]